MKTKNILLYLLLLSFAISSCDYLDILPDEVTVEQDTYQNEQHAKNFLYLCYGSVARRNDCDFMIEWRGRGIEFLSFESTFTTTTYSPSNVGANSYTWGQVWEGIRNCYKFLEVVDKTPDITDENLKYFKAEATFLIGYYHFISLQSYGPTCIMRRIYDPSESIEALPERSSYDEVVAFINEKLDEALPNLAVTMPGADYGRATQGAVWAIKSRMYLYAASPLFNGNKMYADFKSPIDGRSLISQTIDQKKWEISADISKKAIEETFALGHHLYGDAEAGSPSNTKPGPVAPAQRRVRYCFMDDQNQCEVLLAETRAEDIYDMQNRSLPRWSVKPPSVPTNGVGPTLQMVEKFYTKNGLPMEYDKAFDYPNRYQLVDMPVNYDGNNYAAKSNGKNIQMHLNREPRFYAWVGFHNGFVEAAKHNNAVVNSNNAKKAFVLKLRKNDEQGIGIRTNHYCYTGYLSKKFVHPSNEGKSVRYPFPIFRMAELYLNYAEALVEMGGEVNLSLAKENIDVVRERAGLPTLDEAWDHYSNKPGWQNTQEGLREIVRREREIEFYMEGQHFWDSRRWVTIVKEELTPSNPHKILNIEGVSDEDFFQVKESAYPNEFSIGQYLMPIATAEINKMPQLVQQPFY